MVGELTWIPSPYCSQSHMSVDRLPAFKDHVDLHIENCCLSGLLVESVCQIR